MVGFIAEGLPPEAQAALATLQADVAADGPEPGRAGRPRGARRRARAALPRLGARCRWRPRRSARCTGRCCATAGMVAVKVQYPGVDKAISGDLDNAELLYGMFSAVRAQEPRREGARRRAAGPHGRRARLPPRGRAARPSSPTATAATRSSTSPTSCPSARPSGCSPASGSTGMTWAEFEATADAPARQQRAAEVLFRFAQGSIHRHGVFNGDPHPGNYRFHPDGTVTFLDFGLVKRWTPGESERLVAVPRRHPRPATPTAPSTRMVDGRLPRPDHGLDPQRGLRLRERALRAVPRPTSSPSPATFDGRGARPRSIDVNGPYADVIRQAQHAAVVRHPRPGGVGRVGACSAGSRRRDRGGRSSTSTATAARRPPSSAARTRLASGDRALGAGRAP